LSGSYGAAVTPAKLAVGAEATYSGQQQDYGRADENLRLMLTRYDEQVYTHITGNRGRQKFGTALLAGDSRIAAVVLSDSQKDTPQLAVGVYTVAQGRATGKSAFMDNDQDSKSAHGGMAGTLRMPSATEEWTLGPKAADAPAASK